MFNSYTRENSVINNIKFQETEWQDELALNLYDFDARNYDPYIWRTLTHDPHAEDYPEMSPYSFLNNDPVNTLDPTGMDAIDLGEGNNYIATCPTCPQNDPTFKQYIDDPKNNYHYDPASGNVSLLLNEVEIVRTSSGANPNNPFDVRDIESRDPYGFFEYLLTGGYEGDVHYNREGKPTDTGTILGEAPDVGLGKGIKLLKHLHHSFPKFLGGLKKQSLTKMLASQHKALHKEMNAFLRRFGMAPSKINSGAKIQNKFSPNEIKKVLTDFYNGPGAKYTEAAKDFFKQINQ